MAVVDATGRIIAEQQAPITRRQQALRGLTRSIVGGFEAAEKAEQQAKQAEGTRRQEALGILSTTAKLRSQGFDVTPEEIQQQISQGIAAPEEAPIGAISQLQAAPQVAAQLQPEQQIPPAVGEVVPQAPQQAPVQPLGFLEKRTPQFKRKQRLEEAKLKKLEAELGGKGTGATLDKQISDIRKEVSGLAVSKDLAKISASLKKVESGAKQSSAAGDVGLIFNLMKIFDPGSVVRESEFATAQNAGGVPERIQNTWNKLLRGERLTKSQRKDFLTTARRQSFAQVQTFTEFTRPQRQFAKERGLPAEQIFPQLPTIEGRGQAAPVQAAPAVQMTRQQKIELLKAKGFE